MIISAVVERRVDIVIDKMLFEIWIVFGRALLLEETVVALVDLVRRVPEVATDEDANP